MAPIGPRLHNINAHVDIESLTPGSEEWRRAKGNDAADRYAKIAAARGHQLSTNELEQQIAQAALLKKCLIYVSEALQIWPAVSPKAGSKGLAKPEKV
eukprot:55284-Pyramimonas_sp.AAC.1